MTQRSLFDSCGSSDPWHLYVDGASRNNPGPAGAGLYLTRCDKEILKKGFFLGSKTNNQAEYLALALGLFFTVQKMNPEEHLTIFADSQLLVRQMNGVYKVKDPQLKKLQALAFKVLMSCSSYSFVHIPRAQNAYADEMANEGIDARQQPPSEFITLLKQYEVRL